MSIFFTYLTLPIITTNTKPIMGIPKGTEWSLKDDCYVPTGKESGISSQMAWDSGMFSPLDKLKKMGMGMGITSPNSPIFNSHKEKFVPAQGDTIWMVGMNGELMTLKYHEMIHKQNLEFGNVFRDSKSALKAAIKINDLLGGELFNNRNQSKNL